MAEPTNTINPAQDSGASEDIDIRRLNPLMGKSNFASQIFEELESASASAYGILQNDDELSRKAKDLAFVRQLKLLAYSQESADLVMVRLYSQAAAIKKYDEKIAEMVVGYIKERGSLSKILSFIYYNLAPERLRTLYANMDAVSEKVGEIEDKDVRKPVQERLQLMQRIFDQIRLLEDKEMVEKQKRILGWMINRIRKGMSQGSWEGFLGPYGIATNTKYYIDMFSKFHNREVADMLKRKQEKYGESKPEEWLGDERTPDTLMYIYYNLDTVVAQRLSLLWQNAGRIAQSLKAVIENLFGKSPSSALEKVRRRIDLLEKRLKGRWKEARDKATALLISARIKAEEAIKVVIAVEEEYKNFFGQRGMYLLKSYNSNKAYEKNAQALASKGPDFSILLYLLLTARLFENNLEGRIRVTRSIESPVPIEDRLVADFGSTVASAVDAYGKFLDFVDKLELGIPTAQVREKMMTLKGGLNG